ncbi:MAG: hypothetical protein COX62_05490 [Deltaproteobacteria bacterium CG_4_10_14_0_2_um_filter_43_8]|nr:MAG: hypothetical protein COV43_01525 [Deltaproteobacteria bacterium CG11_big_fil_rev_8_21_14_0_20_42_23]PJA19986.1 MAG: hypothetical protein COX62_05490 [Deltaproteobacteria bacterium CG_4_10_14_0_2_um_filter_43_8]PJC64649.1 MAG: hypothetical protein CO021_03040 [Deltaproteobacteria bacterium CG_4_9_14_0_2_um_filter_42_21]
MKTIKSFRDGLAYFFKGFHYFAKHKKLFLYAIIPTLINLALMSVLISYFTDFFNTAYHILIDLLPSFNVNIETAWLAHLLSALIWFAKQIIKLLILLLSILFLFLFFYMAGLILSSPFNDALSEKVEEIERGKNETPFSWERLAIDSLRAIKNENIKTVIFLLIPLVLLLIAFIPVLGSLLYPFITAAFSSFDFGFTYVDLPMARKGYPLKQRLSFSLQHKWSIMGFGSFLLIPFLNFFLMPAMVVGGTLLFLELSETDQP